MADDTFSADEALSVLAYLKAGQPRIMTLREGQEIMHGIGGRFT
jgi:hypothetical protein